MSGSSRWYFTEEQLSNSPSRKKGMTAEDELSQRQRAANLIQEMGQRLQVSQLCINTGIVYMHRFYAFHSFTMFHRNSIAAAAFFLAAKVEEQPRKLEHVIKILNITLEKNDVSREMITEMTQELVFHENVLLQTLGFDVAIDHPHTPVVNACQLFNIVEVSKELRQTCYFMASNSLHLTTMCLKYKPTVVAAFCIYLACRWARWEIPDSSEGRPWYSYVDETVTLDTLKILTDEYLQILERSPSKFKNKMRSITNGQGLNQGSSSRDEPSTSGQSSRHETTSSRHHHTQRSSSGSNSSSSNLSNRKTDVPAQKQPPIMSHSSSYKNQQLHQISQPPVSTSMQRQTTSTTTSSSRASHSNESNTSSNQKPDRTHQDGSSYSNISRTLDPIKQQQQQQSSRMSLGGQTSTLSANPLSSSQQPQPPSSSHIKSSNHDQRHTLGNPKPPVDYQQQQQSKKQTSAVDYQNRSSSSSSTLVSSSHLQQPPQHKPQQTASMKKSAWPQQSQMSQPKSQVPLTASHSHSNLNALHTSSSNNMHRSSSQSNQSLFIDQQSANKSIQSSQPTLSNDMPWFSETDIIQSTQQSLRKNPTPPKQGKSMFSPSPEHEPVGFDRAKMMMLSSTNVKRERESPKNDKSDRRSMTPSKKEKQRAAENAALGMKPQSQSTANMQDKNKHLPGPLPNLIPDSKKRPYEPDMDSLHDMKRENNKSRKVDQKQVDFSLMLNKTQPIETNPDAVKSLLQECFKQEVSKFDVNGDSPLEVLTPTDPNAGSLANLLSIPVSLPASAVAPTAAISSHLMSSHLQPHPSLSLIDHLPPKVEPIDNGTSDDEYSSSHKKHSKSKKKKDKHKKKKKHKSDREDREEEEKRDREAGPLKIVLAKDKSDSNQQNHPSLKIKIPINSSIDFRNNQQMQPQQPAPPAPLKLKISKDKIGGFNNSFADASREMSAGGDGTSSSSSSHKKHKDKDKDRDRHSRKSKHNNNNSDLYQMPHQQQQHYSIGKMDQQPNFMMQPQIPTSFNFQHQLPPQPFDGSTPDMHQQMFSNPAQLRQHQLMQMQNYLYQNSSNG